MSRCFKFLNSIYSIFSDQVEWAEEENWCFRYSAVVSKKKFGSRSDSMEKKESGSDLKEKCGDESDHCGEKIRNLGKKFNHEDLGGKMKKEKGKS